ncbi:helix-turn-helix domain-containing protein [Vibrio splendidus]|uniref:Transcriptional regulator n=1 Tax=Vibrio splendidus TaxID=29497 RepID=A0A2N7F3H1_VIBSP|nr:helix-turn-helix transcriptional regulator [Vibrio splendidus]OEF72300.1 transcriptional regulator [Vibrio splendidus 1F-157]PMI50444.1 transcriptional regulator [Vibrio splendidus]PMI72757.1 transcriptional regulator [Vibrio splendidus]PMI73412.1 transcriptional regulator [Vibrio splendidus]PMJ51889.1 transcriptional regulator [Vibrio splendidus]
MHIGPNFLLAAIRQKLKEQGCSYSELSEKTEIPLSTIKRHLRNPSLGIDKILMYANHVNTDLVELSQLAIQLQHSGEEFVSHEQNALFVEYPYLLDFIYMVTSLHQTPRQVAEKHQLSDTSLRFYLSIAEILGYVELHGDEITFRSGRRFIMKEGSPLDFLFKQRFQQASIAHNTPPQVCQSRVRLTQVQCLQLETEIDKKIHEFHASNSSNNTGNYTNVLLRYTPGEQIRFSDYLPEIDGNLLKMVSAQFPRG